MGEGLRYARGGRVIRDGLDIAARPGEILAVTGPSGSGKSSLLALLAGLERPDEGPGALRRTAAGPDGRPAGPRPAGLRPVGVLTAAENIEVALQAAPGSRTRAEIRAGATVVIATHDLEVAATCDRRVHLVDGRLPA